MAHETYMTAQYGPSHYGEPHHAVGLGIQYHDFDQHSQGYYADHRSHTASPYMQHSMARSSPPTPLSSHGDTRRTRSGRSIVRNDSPHSNGTRGSPPRSVKKKKASDKNKTPKLTAPLSVLTKDMTNVPVRDMEAWVNRSVEERHKEAEKRNGYITRPMNSFMLYRSAYADRTKQWCLHNNHQVVSSVSGESWPLEPPEVREFYNELAKIERLNHQNAHPQYKFSPAKPGNTSSNKKRTRNESDNESEASDLGDPEWGAANGVRSRPSKRAGRETGYPARANLNEAQENFHEVYGHTPGWENWDQPVRPPHNAGTPYPQVSSHPQQYYPSPTMQHQQLHHLQMMPPTQDPYASYDAAPYTPTGGLIGMPGGNHAELLGFHSGGRTPMLEQQLDPLLLAFQDGSHPGMAMPDSLTTAHHPNLYNGNDSAFEQHYANGNGHMPVQYPQQGAGGPLVTEYRPKEWQPDTDSPAFEQATEFDKLWEEHERAQREERKVSLRSTGGQQQQHDGAEESSKSPKSA